MEQYPAQSVVSPIVLAPFLCFQDGPKVIRLERVVLADGQEMPV